MSHIKALTTISIKISVDVIMEQKFLRNTYKSYKNDRYIIQKKLGGARNKSIISKIKYETNREYWKTAEKIISSRFDHKHHASEAE